MRSFTVALVAGAGVLLASSAFAGPMTNGTFGLNDSASTLQVRMVCDEYGRCFEQRRGARRAYIERDSYGYVPRARYREHRHHNHGYNNAPGIGIQVPGVSIGVGGGGRW